MTDVAALAGVSHQTVSRVLNDSPRVRPETRERVLAAIAELGYQRNAMAHSLVTGKTNTIGILQTRVVDFGPSSIVLAVGTAAQERGYFISIAPIADLTEPAVAAGIEQLVSQGVDGIIAVTPNVGVADAITRNPLKCPTVLIAASADTPYKDKLQYVRIDQGYGAELATKQLIAQGHKRIWHLAGPRGFFDAYERQYAYERVMAEAGLTPNLLVSPDWSPKSGYKLGKRIARAARQPDGPTAVFAVNDATALGLISALRDEGLRVPEDISVVGFDDVETAEFCSPPLTTVRQPFTAVGEAAVETLVAMMQDQPATETPHLFKPELVVRDSVAPL